MYRVVHMLNVYVYNLGVRTVVLILPNRKDDNVYTNQVEILILVVFS